MMPTVSQSTAPECSAMDILHAPEDTPSSSLISPENDSPTAPKFCSLPAEIRNKIYRLLFVGLNNLIELEESRSARSAQFLRTCRQVHSEGMSILYGENTFEVEISNTYGPHYGVFSYGANSALNALFNRGAFGRQSPQIPNLNREEWSLQFQKVLKSLIRRFSVKIRYTQDHDIGDLRDAVKAMAWWLQKGFPQIDFLELECELSCDNENDDINYRQAEWDDYNPVGSRIECVRMIVSRLGGCHAKEVGEIEGLGEDDALDLREQWQEQWWKRQEENENGAESLKAVGERNKTQPASLLDRFEALNRATRKATELFKKNTRQALLGAEAGQTERFEVRREKIVSWTRKLLKILEGSDDESVDKKGGDGCDHYDTEYDNI